MKSDAEIAELFMPILKEHGIDAPMETVTTVVGLMKGRVSFIKDYGIPVSSSLLLRNLMMKKQSRSAGKKILLSA